MSVNQSRAERTQVQLNKPNRPVSTGQQGSSIGSDSGGGKDGGRNAPPPLAITSSAFLAAAAAAPSSVFQPLSANRSFKKSGYGRGSQLRINPATANSEACSAAPINTSNRVVQNGDHALVPSPDTSASGGAKPANMQIPRNAFRAIPKAPTFQSASGSSSLQTPSMPPKGDPSKPLTLQFGTINPGIVNGLQIPARTTSAPPNLDEQKRDQARIESFKPASVLSIPTVTKQERQQQSRKDVSVAHQPGNVESHLVPQIKRDVSVSDPSAPVITPPKPSVLPISGMPMPMVMPFQSQQPQIPQFGGPCPQMQPPGLVANSLQMTMTIPVGSASQVAQQIFVPGIQPHFVQQQALTHQGHGFPFALPIDHQLPQQLGNLGMGLNAQFPQQQPSKFISPHKTPVKITHPETHEELKLEKRTDPLKDGVSPGQRSLPNVIPQSQPTSSYTAASQMNYYPQAQQNCYNPSHIFPSSIPLASGQVSSSSQIPRYSYPVGQGQHLSFGNPSMVNNITGIKHVPSTPVRSISQGINLEGLPASASITAKVQRTVKPSIGLQGEQAGASSLTPVVISKRLSMVEMPKSLKSVAEASTYYHRHDETSPDGPAQQLKSCSEPSVSVSFPVTDTSTTDASVLSTVRILPEAISAPEVPAGNYVVVLPGNDDKKREPVQKSDSENNNQKQQSIQQRHQFDASSAEGVQLASQRITKDGFVGELLTSQERIITGPLEGEEIQAASDLSGLEKETSSSHVSFPRSYSLGVASDGISINEDSEATTSLDPMLNGINSESPDTNLNAINTLLNVTVVEMLDFSEKSEVSNASSRDPDDTKVKLFSTIEKFSTLSVPVMLSKQDDGDDEKVKVSDIIEFDNKMFNVTIEDDGSKVESKRVNVEIRPVDASLHSNDSTAFNSDIPSADDNKRKCDASITKCDINNCRNVDLADSGVASIQTAVSKLSGSLIAQKSNADVDFPSDGVTSAIGLGQQEKPYVVITKPKINIEKRKKRKEILSKADAAGSSDLYNAYKGPVEKHEVDTNSESIESSSAGTGNAHLEYPDMDVSHNEKDVQSKAELDDWENAADISTPKLQTSEFGQSAAGESKQDDDAGGYEATSQKKYSRDFLLTLSQQFTDLPVGFEIGSDIADILMISPLGQSPYPSPGRSIDRPSGASKRRLVGNLDDDKWMRSPASSGAGRDPRLDVGYGAPITNPRPGHRNSRGQALNQFGGILSGPMPLSPQGGMPRVSPDVDRWQRARGLIPSQTPLQVMHKAEKKYEVRKVADEEEAKQRQLKAILNKLTPQNFERLFDQVKEVNIDNAVTLTGIISQIFDKALMEPTFCEMYANFCFHLAGALPDFNEDNEKITFKRLLLNKCQEEFERGEREQAEANKVDEEGEIKQSKEEREEKRLQARRRMLGNIRLIGELYKKKMLTERIMHECIKKLLGQYESPDEEDIEALCKLMSTIGEMIDHPKAKEHMDFYFDTMKKLSTNQKLSSRVRFMLRDVIDLRKNKWQHRRKVEGPKKIEEVHRDAAQEKQAQSSRLARGPVINNVPRRGQAVDYGIHRSTTLSTPNSQQTGSVHGLPSQARGYGNQDVRLEGRPQFESRTLSLPLLQRSIDELSSRDHNSYHRSRELKLDHTFERSANSTLSSHSHGTSGSHLSTVCEPSTYSEEVLQEKTISAIREFYSVKDETEVVLCIKELNAPSFYRSVISLWITDSFERRDTERDLLSKLIINLCKSNDNLFSQVQLLQGFESVLSSLEDAINDAPRAAEFLGRIFAKIVMENVVPLTDIGTLLLEGGEESGRLREIGLAAEVLGNILETIRSEKVGTVLNEIGTSSNLNLKDFLPRHPTKSKLDAFL